MATKTKLTYEDYKTFPDDGNRYEIIDGEVYVTAAPVEAHQWAVGEVQAILRGHVQEHHLGRVCPAPFAVIFRPRDVYESDVLYSLRERLDIIDIHGRVRGVPDLCIEVASESTRERDRTFKYERYAHFGVLEYWILDPDPQTVEIFVLENDMYRLLVTAHSGEYVQSRVLPELELAVSNLFTRW
ncbi:MAG: Uma2 family endonuclease [Chloroflexota bacterium]|nr:Uma2 family endonuclease [Chloroflexota bacterium]